MAESRQGMNSATTSEAMTMVFTPCVSVKRARFFPEYSTSTPPASSVSASGVSNGMRESSAGVTTGRTNNRIRTPMIPRGPTSPQMGYAWMLERVNGSAIPETARFHPMAIRWQ